MVEFYKNKKYDVEHALNMYAHSFVLMPAFGIYEDHLVAPLQEQIRDCHIYLIGKLPKIEVLNVEQISRDMVMYFRILGRDHSLHWPLPEGATLNHGSGGDWYVRNQLGENIFPTNHAIMSRLCHEKNLQDFEILYIGQAFGDEGSRNALDRLKKHETLQKIAINGISTDYLLYLIMLKIVPQSRMITMFNPFAQDREHGEARIEMGISKLIEITEAERTTLYEASLIRYFQPRYNKEFKNSFPSTNMKILKDCYSKDIATIIAEICLDHFPVRLYTDSIPPKVNHIAQHDLHTDTARRVFFLSKA
jgi:hypothetical protein